MVIEFNLFLNQILTDLSVLGSFLRGKSDVQTV